MDISNLEIIAPEGMEYFIEDNKVKFRPKQTKLTYDYIAKKLFENNECYFTDMYCAIKHSKDGVKSSYKDLNNCTSELQAKKLLAINQLMNVAKYLNGDWKPDWNNDNEFKYTIAYNADKENLEIKSYTYICVNTIYFKTKELAQQAIEILGKETIRLALTTDW